jgi:hypothetical protein
VAIVKHRTGGKPLKFSCLLALIAAGLLSAGTADARPMAKKPRVVKAVTSAEGAGAIATATATCPRQTSAGKGRWRALSGGFTMTTNGSGVVYESRRDGQRSWRISAQSLSGKVELKAYANCQRGVPKPRAVSSTVATPGTSEVGPAAVAKCQSGYAVAGGFSTPPPFTATGAANTVVGSLPNSTKAWRVLALSDQASSLTSHVYCAKRKRKPKIDRAVIEPTSTATLADTLAFSTTNHCPGKQFAPGGGGFEQQGISSSQYLIPNQSLQRPSVPGTSKPLPPGYRGNVWDAHGLKVGNGTPVTLVAVALCG